MSIDGWEDIEDIFIQKITNIIWLLSYVKKNTKEMDKQANKQKTHKLIEENNRW